MPITTTLAIDRLITAWEDGDIAATTSALTRRQQTALARLRTHSDPTRTVAARTATAARGLDRRLKEVARG